MSVIPSYCYPKKNKPDKATYKEERKTVRTKQ